MPVYRYKGIAAGNRSVSATIDADSPRAARTKLRAEGIFPTDISEGRAGSRASEALARIELPMLQRVPDLDLAMMTGQLATLISAGVPLVQSLAALTEQVDNDRLKTILGTVRTTVNQGTPLADALGEFPYVFDDLYCSMVRSGEAAGALHVVLKRLAEYVEGRMALRNKVINAMIYPILMLAACVVVAGVLLVKVIPTITTMLQDMNQPLPLPTVIVIFVSEFVRDWWLPFLVLLVASYLVLQWGIRTERGRLIWDRFRLRLPILGRTIRYVAIARFARTLSTLQAGGLNIVQSLDISGAVAGNAVIAAALAEAREAITRGATIASTMQRSGEFPAMVTHMVSVGEASGELDSMLAKLAETYDQIVDNSLDRMTALMGPILLLVVASLVVMIILSTLLPLLNLTAAL